MPIILLTNVWMHPFYESIHLGANKRHFCIPCIFFINWQNFHVNDMHINVCILCAFNLFEDNLFFSHSFFSPAKNVLKGVFVFNLCKSFLFYEENHFLNKSKTFYWLQNDGNNNLLHSVRQYYNSIPSMMPSMIPSVTNILFENVVILI